MRKISNLDMDAIKKAISCELVIESGKYYAVAFVHGDDGEWHFVVTESGDSFEDAAEGVWRTMCDNDCMQTEDDEIFLISEDASVVSTGIIPVAHYIFDHGSISFVDAMWNELKQDITEAFKKNDKWNLNGWTIEDAVEEMVTLWQYGSCEKMPWEISGDWVFINEEFDDVLMTPKS